MSRVRAGVSAFVIGSASFGGACVTQPIEKPTEATLDGATAVCRVPETTWGLWHAYKGHFVADDGRVVDFLANHSTSEGQAYGLFFALVAKDQPAFARILRWTVENLAAGDLAARLPAWQWGEKTKGGWGVLDPNAASDADLWIAYALDHAAVVFAEPAYHTLAMSLLQRIAAEEVTSVDGLGDVLLPGPHGFVLPDGKVRFNHSYVPVQVLRWAARVDPQGPWERVIATSVKIAEGATPGRVYPDWVTYDPARGFISDVEKGAVGSYDAIRAYLWPAMLPKSDPHRGALLARGSRLLDGIRTIGRVPERVATDGATGHLKAPDDAPLNAGPVGFQAVGAVYAGAVGDARLAANLAASVAKELGPDGLYGTPPFYYDHNLILFAEGFADGRYAFRLNGELALARDDGTCAEK